jgi:hypothetical protein
VAVVGIAAIITYQHAYELVTSHCVAAIQNGGGMLLLADPGYARLAEPVRFRAPWGQAVSQRLRDGDSPPSPTYPRDFGALAR